MSGRSVLSNGDEEVKQDRSRSEGEDVADVHHKKGVDGDEKGHNNRTEERHPKKKKKEMRASKTNWDTCLRRGDKFRRLKKFNTEEQAGFSYGEDIDRNKKGRMSGNDEAATREYSAEEQLESHRSRDMNREDDEMANFIDDDIVSRMSGKKKKRKHAPCVSLSSIQESRDIFGGPRELLHLKQKWDAHQCDERQEDLVEPSIFYDKYMTPKDVLIREADIPERIQLFEEETGPPPIDDTSIEEERTWIYARLNTDVKSLLPVLDYLPEEISKEEIGNVLRMMHVQKLEVPFIIMYRRELCASLLKEPGVDVLDTRKPLIQWHKVLWAIHTLDKKWLILRKRKNSLHLNCSKRYKEEALKLNDDKCLALKLRLLKSIDVLKNANFDKEVDDAFAKFNLYLPPGEVKTNDKQFKRPTPMPSLYRISEKAGLREVANMFSINSEKFGLFLAHGEVGCEDMECMMETPNEFAAGFTSRMFDTPEHVLKGARHMVAFEIYHEPTVRNYVRSFFMRQTVISTIPTSQGNQIIDSGHQLSGVNWLCNKPISEFKDAQWLLIHDAEEKKLLQVTIKLPDDVKKKLLSYAEEYSLCKGVNKYASLWSGQRKMILEESFLTYIIPALEDEAAAWLYSRSKFFLKSEYGKKLWNKVSVRPPFQRKEKEVVDSGKGVLACCWGPGKSATTFVMLDSEGELLDSLYAGSLSCFSDAVTARQLRKNDEEKVKKFVAHHQPHIVCVGGSGLPCRQLVDKLHKIFIRVAEESPKMCSQDFRIIITDESLSQLYENSRISSHQLSGHPDMIRRAVGLGRYLQNPLAMVATLCGPDREILSWKLCPLQEFLTPDEKYEMVEQVVYRYVDPLICHLDAMLSHCKFRSGKEAEISVLLRAEKADNPVRIVYCFCISHDQPGSFIFCYIKNVTLCSDQIGLYHKGFRFRSLHFSNIDALVDFLEEFISKPQVKTLKLNAQRVSMVPMNTSCCDTETSSCSGTNSPNGNMNDSVGLRDHPSGIPRSGQCHGLGRARGWWNTHPCMENAVGQRGIGGGGTRGRDRGGRGGGTGWCRGGRGRGTGWCRAGDAGRSGVWVFGQDGSGSSGGEGTISAANTHSGGQDYMGRGRQSR